MPRSRGGLEGEGAGVGSGWMTRTLSFSAAWENSSVLPACPVVERTSSRGVRQHGCADRVPMPASLIDLAVAAPYVTDACLLMIHSSLRNGRLGLTDAIGVQPVHLSMSAVHVQLVVYQVHL